jgi:flagellar motor switch protein FliM
MTVRPFQWNLKQATQAEVQVQEQVRHFFPTEDMRQAVTAALRTTLVKHLGKEVVLFRDDISMSRFGEFTEQIGDAATLVAIGMPPVKQRIVCQIDHSIAGLVIDRLLGGKGGRGTEPLALTETEQGVLQFLLMECLGALHTACGVESPYHFRFERFLMRANELSDQAPAREPVVVLTWRCGLGESVGVVRLAIPQSFAAEARLPQRVRMSSAGLIAQLARFEGERFRLWAEAGECALTAADLTGLEKGDVILLDHTDLSSVQDAPTGRVMLRVGSGRNGGLRCQLASTSRLACCVEGVDDATVSVEGER